MLKLVSVWEMAQLSVPYRIGDKPITTIPHKHYKTINLNAKLITWEKI